MYHSSDLEQSEYSNPEKLAKDLCKYPQVQSVAFLTGEWDVLLKIRTLTTLKEFKTEFITVYK